MTAADVFRQAEELKVAAQDTSRGANEAWMSRQALQDVYQKLLVMDLEYALDKKVEQELWNHAFKNQISTLQNQAKDKQNQKRGEIQASLNLFLETASGFYFQLLQELCSTFKLDLPFRKKASYFGIIKEYGPVNQKIKLPKKTSCMYICQHCLVHLGDIARYRQQIDQAQAYYRHAARLVPFNGQPYNQLAILEAAKGNKLSTVFYYIRSIAVKHPFPVAATNLEKLYSKLSKDSHEYRQKLTAADIVTLFLQLHTFAYLCINLSKAKSHVEKIICNLPPNIASMSFSSYQLVQMVALNLYSLHHSKRKLHGFRGSGEPSDETCRNRSSESSIDVSSESLESAANGNLLEAYELMFSFTASMFDVLLQAARKQAAKARESPVLPPLKVLLDWLRCEPDALSDPAFSNPVIWLNLCKVLNSIQVEKDLSSELQTYKKTPLAEDCDLECFLPVNKALSELDFTLTPTTDSMSDETETGLRCLRLVAAGFWIAEDFPSLNLLNVQHLSSGCLDFTTQLQVTSATVGENSSELKATHQNVAIQAILQKEKNQRGSSAENKSNDGRAQKTQIKLAKKESEVNTTNPQKLDAGIMTSSDCISDFDDRVNLAKKKIQSTTRDADLEHSSGSSLGFGVPQLSVHSAPFIQSAYPCQPSNEASFVPPHLPHSIFGGPYGPQRLPSSGRVSDMGVSSTQNMLNQESSERRVSSSFEPFPRMFHMPPPSPAMIGQSYFPVGQHVGFPRTRNPQPMFMQTAERFPHAHSVSAPITISNQPWPSSSTLMSMNHYNAMSMSGSDAASGGILRHTEEISSISPDQELKESVKPLDSPNQLFDINDRRFSSSPRHLLVDLCDSHLLPQSGSSPYSRSPSIDALQLSRSLPTNVRFGGQPFGSSIPNGSFQLPETLAAIPTDTGIASSPFSSFFQGPHNVFGSDDAIGKNTAYNFQDSVPTSPYQNSTFPSIFGSRNEVPLQNSSGIDSSSFSQNASSSSSLFSTSTDERVELQPPSTNTYTLFSQSPWPLGISSNQTSDTNSHRSSPFGSSNSGSLRATPDPFSSDERQGSSGANLNSSRPLGAVSASGPWKTAISESSAAPLRNTSSAESDSGLVTNMQSLWTSGPSPLQKLLDQQKQQRQLNPR